MHRNYVGLAVVAGAMLAAHGAAAQGAWYISGSAGAVLPFDYSRPVTFSNRVSGLHGPGTNTTTYTAGEDVNLALGYQLPLGFRIEGELGYQHYGTNSVSPLSTDGLFPALNGSRLSNPSGGAHNLYTATANLFYDLPVTFAGFTPYIGGGAGYYHGNSTDAVFYNSAGGKIFTSGGSSGGNAIVLGEVGASYAMSQNLSFVTSYRYEHLFRVGNSAPNENIVKVGIRYTFGAPAAQAVAAPAPVAIPAAAPARSFLVFFDWDKATLTERARQIVAEAATTSTKVQYTRIEVNGYTDTSGTPQYNRGLSVRRAQTVASELVRDGVPKTAISIQGFGETHPLVPTGPGVREPQNRRVEIIIR